MAAVVFIFLCSYPANAPFQWHIRLQRRCRQGAFGINNGLLESELEHFSSFLYVFLGALYTTVYW